MSNSTEHAEGGVPIPGNLQPKSRIRSVEYRFISLVEPVSGDSPIVLCSDTDGTNRYASLDEWRAGEQRVDMRSLPPSCAAVQMGRTVSSASPTTDKLALFRLLFTGRDDVHAESYHDKKRDGIAYSPACTNFWKRGICPKRDRKPVRCADCEMRAFSPLSDRLIIDHMKGDQRPDRSIIGSYPLVDDCMTNFLVVDFDGEGWQKAISSYRNACSFAGVPLAVERSRSGNGAHVWVFFTESAEAGKARKMGAALLTLAMKRSGDISFDSYDRMLPNQDVVPKSGFGNLVALPFQGNAMCSGNTMFVNETFTVYSDQWTYLSYLGRMSDEDIEAAIARLGKNALGMLVKLDEGQLSGPEDASHEKLPWQPRQKTILKPSDTPDSVEIVRANGIHVPKAGLSAALLDSLRRLAAMANPQFYKMQAMRQSVYGTPRILHLEHETEEWLGLPRTCEKGVESLLESCGTEVGTRDERSDGRKIRVAFRGALRDEQARVADEMSRFEDGIIVAETGFGKTVVAARLIAQVKVSTLVVVPTAALLAQWRNRLAEFLDIDEEPPVLLTPTGRKSRRKASVIGQIGNGRREPSSIIDIALIGSLFEKDGIEGERLVSDLVGKYGMVIVDECHHASAPNYTEVLSAVRSRRLFGMTATPKRSDDLQGIMYMLLGPVRCKAAPRDTAFSRLLLPRFTKTSPEEEMEGDFVKTIDCVCSDDARTALIVDDVIDAWEDGRTPLVLTRRVEHAEMLHAAITARGCPALLLTGGGTPKEKREKLEGLAVFSPNAPFVLVGTESYLGEGFDEKRLDTLFVAAPMAFEGLVAQCVGRIQRDCEGKTDVVVYDYVDESIRMLDRMFRRRLKEYGRLGYMVGSPAREDVRGELVGREGFLRRLDADIEGSVESVLIASSELHLNRLASALKILVLAKNQGLRISAFLQKPSQDSARKAERTERAADLCARQGISVQVLENCPNLVVLDGCTVWYGGMAPLAFPREDEQVLRMSDSAVANDLAASITGIMG